MLPHLPISIEHPARLHGKPRNRARWTASHIICAILFIVLLMGCSSRPPAIPVEHRDALPWGAVSTEGGGNIFENYVSSSLEASLNQYETPLEDTDGDDIPRFAVLGLSGGGSNGAFAVGLLSGWTQNGTRPEFKVVTGISTGALISTLAFLGPEFDAELVKLYTSITNDQVFRVRNSLSALFSDSLRDTAPLRKTISQWIDERILALVAEEHRKGRRLYVASTDLDGNRLVAWDMGAIAASDREDRLERYRDVLLASAAIPVAFPPVYFPVDIDGRTYWQTHVDGGAKANFFFSGFMADVQRVLEARQLEKGVQVDFYLIVNSMLEPQPLDKPVGRSIVSIAEATVWSMSWSLQSAQLARLYSTIRRMDQNYYLAGIPSDYPDPLNSSDFDPDSMRALEEYARNLAANGYPWRKQPPGLDWREIRAGGSTTGNE